MAASLHQEQWQAASFQSVLRNFTRSLTNEQKNQFSGTTLEDLHVAIEEVQQRQALEKRLQSMSRLKRFLEGMKEYDKVITVFLNSSQILAFVWGPMKFLLQTACTFSEAFDALLDAYQQIGEHIPLLTQYEHHFRNQPHMASVLRLFYEDLLDFHWKAMRHFKKPMWKQFFHAVWRSFDTEFGSILRNLRIHRELVESQANITEFAELMRNQELTKSILEKQEQEETSGRLGKWLLAVKQFQTWFRQDSYSNQLLWLTGIPGAASLVVEEARKLSGVAVAFFYCKHQDAERNTFLAVARGILAQLLHQDDNILAYLYDERSKSGQPTLQTATLARKLLKLTVKNHQKVYIIIDGIDECDSGEERRNIVTTFGALCQPLNPNDVVPLRCLFVSQDDRSAQKDFSGMAALRMTEADMKKDIKAYASIWSSKIREKFELSLKRQKKIEDEITDNAEGMFLYARLMSHHLYSQNSVKTLDHELLPGVFPRGPARLEEIYGRITRRLLGASDTLNSDALKLLSWLVCAKRPLRWNEIQCAVSVDLDEQTVEWQDRRFRVNHKDLCGSLVDIHSDYSVNLVHRTAKGYLVENNLVDMAFAERSIVSLSVGYLSFPSFEVYLQADELELYLSLGYYGLLDYAYANWSRHVDKMLSLRHPDDALQEVAEALSIFADMYWSPPGTKVSVPKSVIDRLKPIAGEDNTERIASAVYLSRKQLLSSPKPTPEEIPLQLEITLLSLLK
ncbi:hypothetical protein K458DRAFT_393383 [Lentithecium fluviatile CBS 122367]|uniref:NACHT domain-containing protein n=1 Tax=Lentithecium fluviatile CBS 122367 TaxID=1168545 RepID=A0A6G1IQ91_9PLEO|nr:hypothetical protein K458DRAFT_393383 [Lentithecium fluviatile CBS 122367]